MSAFAASASQQRRAAAVAAALETRRKASIRAIKAAQRQLGLDDATYRDMLEAQTRTIDMPGKRSAAECSLRELGKVLDYMRRQGAAHPTRGGGRKRTATPAPDRADLMAKVHALLTALGELEGRPYSLNYADAICKRNGWAERVDFCGPFELHKLVGALSRTLRARQGRAAA